MLLLNGVKAVYSGVVLALNEVSVSLEEGSTAVLLGANGSGKSTMLKSISGVLKLEDGELTEGTVELDGKRIDRLAPEQIACLGIRHVLQGRSVFAHLTTEENLLIGAYIRRDKHNVRKDLARMYEYFPKLVARRNQKGGYLSGGEQQMLATARALMGRPRIVLLDEPSLGLAPTMLGEIFGVLKRINEEDKTSLLIAEQNAAAALDIADYGYVLQNGRVASSGPADLLKESPQVKGAYLGLREAGSLFDLHNGGGADIPGEGKA